MGGSMRVLIFFLVSIFSFSLFSMPVGNPSFPCAIEDGIFTTSASQISFRVGYEGDFISDRRLKQETDPSKRINNLTQYLNSALVTVNLLNRLDLFGSYGKAKLKADWIFEESENVFSYIELETRYGEAWSCGGNVILFEWGNTCFTVGGGYAYKNPKILWLSKNGEVFPIAHENFKFFEWQVSAGLSQKMDIFIPYICAKYSKAQAYVSNRDTVISSDQSDSLKMKSKNNYGMALGCALLANKYFMLNVEVRLIDEEAFSIVGDFKF